MTTVALILGLSARASPQDTASTAATYRALVSAYRNLDADSMRRLDALPHPAIEAIVNDLRGADRHNWPGDDVRAAAMLHTDTGIELLKAGHLERGVFHINVATRLIDQAVDAAPRYASYRTRWFDVVTALLRSYGAPAWAEELRKRAQARSTGSPARHLLAMALQEELEAAQEPLPLRPVSRPFAASRADRARRYSSIAGMFEKAVDVDPECYEAWLHLGRTRMLAGDDRSAALAFERAKEAPDPRHGYLATMFLGAIAEREERFDDAEKRYVEAAAVYPRGQSAPIALSHLLSRIGREPDARETLARHQARARGIVVDPLWTYLAGTNEHLAATLNELRAEVWQ